MDAPPRPRGRTLATLTLALALASAGCGTPPWQASQSPTPSASASATPTPVVNDLAKGSLKRTLRAGAAVLDVSYWSTLDLGQWTPGVPKPLNVVVTATLEGGAKGQQTFLSAARASTTATGADGVPQVLDAVDDSASVAPGYLISKPNSYQQVLTLPAAPAGSTSVRITLTYELLIQSAPKADTYLRQATSDTIEVPLATAPAATTTP